MRWFDIYHDVIWHQSPVEERKKNNVIALIFCKGMIVRYFQKVYEISVFEGKRKIVDLKAIF